MRKDYNKVSKNPAKIDESDSLDLTSPKDLLQMRVTNCQRLNVRADPDTRSLVLCVLAKDDTIAMIDTNIKWAHISTDAGVDGYVMREFIKEV